jgi:hypothetical protein
MTTPQEVFDIKIHEIKELLVEFSKLIPLDKGKEGFIICKKITAIVSHFPSIIFQPALKESNE